MAEGAGKSASLQKKGKSTKKAKTIPLRRQAADEIFALDIGTRTVVGVVAKSVDGVLNVIAAHSLAHTRRAMTDGQIEEVGEVAKLVGEVRAELEKQTGIRLKNVSIAAAGRALRTSRTSMEFESDGSILDEEAVRSLELETVAKAASSLDGEDGISFHCVGYSVVSYSLDGYAIKSLLNHRGRNVSVDIIAAFLPNIVVESLYAVTDINKLTVSSLTLEPIAAMNVVIPPEVRLINIALVDIGAGTSDIAVSKGGYIVAYAMATVAGDEITEDIITRYLVDFTTAEEMKLSSGSQTIYYNDIFGTAQSISAEEFCKSLSPSVDKLAEVISEQIMAANGEAPQAVFLVGGGSLISGLPETVADKLGMPIARVAVGGQVYKGINTGDTILKGPEYVTPVGIALTATLRKGFDFSTVTVNGRRIRVLDTHGLTVLDLLMKAGFRTNQIIGRSGRSLNFTLNGEKQMLKGEVSTPAVLTLNGRQASVDMTVKQGDRIEITPAKSGISAEIALRDIAGEISDMTVTLAGKEYSCGNTVTVNGVSASDGGYEVRNGDDIRITGIKTLRQLCSEAGVDLAVNECIINGNVLDEDYSLSGGEVIGVRAKAIRQSKRVYSTPQPAADVKPADNGQANGTRILLNGRTVTLEPHTDGSPHQFIELLALADIDLDHPSPSGEAVMELNGKPASLFDVISSGDRATAGWKNN